MDLKYRKLRFVIATVSLLLKNFSSNHQKHFEIFFLEFYGLLIAKLYGLLVLDML